MGGWLVVTMGGWLLQWGGCWLVVTMSGLLVAAMTVEYNSWFHMLQVYQYMC